MLIGVLGGSNPLPVVDFEKLRHARGIFPPGATGSEWDGVVFRPAASRACIWLLRYRIKGVPPETAKEDAFLHRIEYSQRCSRRRRRLYQKRSRVQRIPGLL
jgi:hypothetical protein